MLVYYTCVLSDSRASFIAFVIKFYWSQYSWTVRILVLYNKMTNGPESAYLKFGINYL